MGRREVLKSYLLEVTRDLINRGMIRKANGQSLSDVLRTEPRAVLAGVQEDLVAVSIELGVGFAKGAGEMLANGFGGPIGEIAKGLGNALGEWLQGKQRR